MNISGLIVKTLPEHVENLVKAFQESEICDYHTHDEKGIIILTVEGENMEDEISKLKQIQTFEHVISVNHSYSYSEDELDALRHNIEIANDLPAWLNNESVPAEQIKYQGDIKNKL